MMMIRCWIGLALGLGLAASLLTGCRTDESVSGEAGERHEEQGHDEHGDSHGEEGIVELSPEAIARIGLTTVPAALRPLVSRHATTGKVGFDERHLAHVSARVSGRLVRVEAELGDRLREGEILAVVDSVELGQARAA